MSEVARQISIGRRVTVQGVDQHGRFVREELLLVDQPVMTKSSFRYIGPWWWCRWMQARAWLRDLFR